MNIDITTLSILIGVVMNLLMINNMSRKTERRFTSLEINMSYVKSALKLPADVADRRDG